MFWLVGFWCGWFLVWLAFGLDVFFLGFGCFGMVLGFVLLGFAGVESLRQCFKMFWRASFWAFKSLHWNHLSSGESNYFGVLFHRSCLKERVKSLKASKQKIPTTAYHCSIDAEIPRFPGLCSCSTSRTPTNSFLTSERLVVAEVFCDSFSVCLVSSTKTNNKRGLKTTRSKCFRIFVARPSWRQEDHFGTPIAGSGPPVMLLVSRRTRTTYFLLITKLFWFLYKLQVSQSCTKTAAWAPCMQKRKAQVTLSLHPCVISQSSLAKVSTLCCSFFWKLRWAGVSFSAPKQATQKYCMASRNSGVDVQQRHSEFI